jgi:predicted permease
VFRILYEVIAPVFVLIGVGYLVQKRLGLDLKTLTRLNFWIFVPAFLFVRIYESTLSGAQLGQIFVHFLLFFPLLGILTWLFAGGMKFPDRMKRALTASVLFYNSGNYGIPVAKLAFPGAELPLQVQAAIVMMQNISNFTIGVFLIAGGRGARRRDTLKEVMRLPMIYVLVLAWLMRWLQIPVPAPVNQGLHWLESALVPVAVVTLGAQMAGLKAPRIGRALAASLVLRLGFRARAGFRRGVDARNSRATGRSAAHFDFVPDGGQRGFAGAGIRQRTGIYGGGGVLLDVAFVDHRFGRDLRGANLVVLTNSIFATLQEIRFINHERR